MKFLALREFIQDSFVPPPHPGETPDPDHTAGRPRIAFIDLAKGLCILLVVLYHLDGQLFGIPNFSALRMPLYFALSGLFFKPCGSIAAFTVKKVNNILVPFLFWVLLGYVLLFLYRAFELSEIYPPVKLVEGFITRIIPPNYPLWFLFCLFVTHILFCLLTAFLDGIKLLTGVLALALIGCTADSCHVYLAMWFDSACTAMPFFYMGYLLKQSPLLDSRPRRTRTLAAGLLCIAAAYLLYYLFGEPSFDLCFNTIRGNILVLYLDSLLFVLGVLLVSKAIRWLPVLSYWGRYSIVILCVQALFFTHLHRLVFEISGHYMTPLQYRTLVLLLCWLSIPLCRRYLPWFIAQKPLFRTPRRHLAVPPADPVG